MSESTYRFFKRDISWLSFNERVLLEARDERLPVYERIKFLSIYSSNLEEFYKIRVSGYHSSLLKSIKRDESVEEALNTISEINSIVTEHEQEYNAIFNGMILPELKRNGIVLYQTHEVEPFHQAYVEQYFNEEVFPYLQPMIIQKDVIHSFIQDGRIYQAISLQAKKKKREVTDVGDYIYALMKIPYTKIPRFVELPQHAGNHYIIFIDDVIKANLASVFPGYDIVDCFSIKISRDADFSLRARIRRISPKILRKVASGRSGRSPFQYDHNARLLPVTPAGGAD